MKREIRRELRHYRSISHDGLDEFSNTWINGPSTTEEKIYYGSDSDSDIESFGEENHEFVGEISKGQNLKGQSQTVMYQKFLLDEWKRQNHKLIL